MIAIAAGQVIAGRYLLERPLASGGMGLVWVVRHLQLDSLMAAKFINAQFANSPVARGRFEREARAAAQLRSPHVVQVHDYGVERDTPYLVMELLQGEDLGTRLRRSKTLSPAAVAEILTQAARALRRAQEAGIVHRDLKPSNIFLAQNDEVEMVKVLDFGIAKTTSGLGGDDATKSGQMLGSPYFMSPEQARSKPVDHRTDLWALAAIGYRALTGEHPFRGDSVYEVLMSICQDPVRPPSQRVPGLPTALDAFFERAFAKAPGARFQSAPELAAAFAEAAVAPERSPRSVSLSQRPPASRGGDFWVTLEAKRSLLHSVDPHEGASRVRRVVLVFILGSSGDEGSAWSWLPQSLLAQERVDIDVLMVRPELRGGGRAALTDAAFDVRATIEIASLGALGFVFVADRPGAQVLREMLLRDYDVVIEGLRDERLPNFDASIVLRTRQIVEIASPESSRPGPDSATDELAAVAHEYEARTREAAEVGLPCPLYRLVDGPPAAGETASDPEAATAHPISDTLNLHAYLDEADQAVAHVTISRSFELDRAAQITSLIERAEATPTESSRPTLEYAVSGSQREVHDRVLGLLRTSSVRPRTMVISGDAGVGKSTAIRVLGRTLALAFQQDVGGRAPLPIICPLQQETLGAEVHQALSAASPGERGKRLFTAVVERWCAWGNALPGMGGVLSPRWFEARLQNQPTVLMLDGVDEFLANNAGIGLSELREMLHYVTHDLAPTGDLSVVLGVRSSQPGIRTLPTNAGHVFEILRLTVSQAQERFPGITRLLLSIPDPAARMLLLTPLLLSWLGPRSEALAGQRIQSPAEVIEQALLAIVEESHLDDVLDADQQQADASSWLDALTLIGWIFSAGFRGDIDTDTLKAEAARISAAWQAFSEERVEDEAAYLLARGFRLVADPRTCDALLKRSVFFPTGPQRVRFMHREWQDFLTARYLAAIIRARNVDELGVVGISPRLHRAAGELLDRAGFVIDEHLVRQILTRAVETGKALIAANFNALIASSRVPMDGPAIDLLLSALGRMKPVARIIALNGISYRALRDEDPSARELRLRLLPIYDAYLPGGAAAGEAMMASISWCYLKAFAHRFRTRAPRVPWPGLGADAETQDVVLRVISAVTEDGPRLLAEHRSVQAAFLQAQDIVVTDPHRPISVVHYLYHLVVARRHDAHIPELAKELPAILDPKGPVAKAITSYEPVPELGEIFQTCRRIHDEIVPPSR